MDLLWEWTDDDEYQWQACQQGIHRMYSIWIDMAIEAALSDPKMQSALPPGSDVKEWFQTHLEQYRVAFCSSPRNPQNIEAARQVGFAHITAHVLPSWYVGMFNLLFSAYHTLQAMPSAPELPPMLTIRRRWLSDVKVTLDTYDVVLNWQIAQLNDLALTDSLTGLLNRRGLWQRIQQDMAQGVDAAFVLLDLDTFKEINDANGHPHGDYLLRQFAQFARSIARSGDAFGRLGGDEFAWWVADVPTIQPLLDRLTSLANRLLAVHKMKFSAGVAWYPRDGSNTDALYHAADSALYRAKNAGGFSCAVAKRQEMYRFSRG